MRRVPIANLFSVSSNTEFTPNPTYLFTVLPSPPSTRPFPRSPQLYISSPRRGAPIPSKRSATSSIFFEKLLRELSLSQTHTKKQRSLRRRRSIDRVLLGKLLSAKYGEANPLHLRIVSLFTLQFRRDSLGLPIRLAIVGVLGWRLHCTRRSIGGSSISSTLSRYGEISRCFLYSHGGNLTI